MFKMKFEFIIQINNFFWLFLIFFMILDLKYRLMFLL